MPDVLHVLVRKQKGQIRRRTTTEAHGEIIDCLEATHAEWQDLSGLDDELRRLWWFSMYGDAEPRCDVFLEYLYQTFASSVSMGSINSNGKDSVSRQWRYLSPLKLAMPTIELWTVTQFFRTTRQES